MKILTFCNYPVYMSMYTALSNVGNSVIVLDIFKVEKSMQYSYVDNVLDEIKPDIILTVGRPEVHGLSLEGLKIIYNDFGINVGEHNVKMNGISLEGLNELCRKKGIKHVYWATEDRTFHEKYSMAIAKNFDYIFTPAAECVESYKALGIDSSVLKYGCSPLLHRNVGIQKEYECDISIAASYHDGMNCNYIQTVIKNQENDNENILRKSSIEELVMPLIDKGYNLSIWGNGWENFVPKRYLKGYLAYQDLNKLYSSSKIVLGLEWDGVSETKTTGRPYEVLGCNTLYLTLKTKALSNIFTDKKHLLLSSSKCETLALVEYYLNNEIERNKISEEGQKEVYEKHTYFHRAGEFINAIKTII